MTEAVFGLRVQLSSSAVAFWNDKHWIVTKAVFSGRCPCNGAFPGSVEQLRLRVVSIPDQRNDTMKTG